MKKLLIIFLLYSGVAAANDYPGMFKLLDLPAQKTRVFKEECLPYLGQEDEKKSYICRVSTFDYLGRIGEKHLFYALYEYGNNFENDQEYEYSWTPSQIVVFESDEKRKEMKPVISHGGGSYGNIFSVGKPELYMNRMVIPLRHSGTGAFNDNRHVQYIDGELKLIDISEAFKDVEMPPKTSFWKGVTIDIVNLQAVMGVWNEGDGNCCPSGGIIFLKFKLQDSKLKLDKQFHSKEANFNSDWKEFTPEWWRD